MASGSALGSAAGGAAGLIEAVSNLLPTTTTAKGHTETKSTANSNTQGGEFNTGQTSTTGKETSSNTTNSNNSNQNNSSNNTSVSGQGTESGTSGSTTTSSGQSTENFSGQSNSTTTQTMLTEEGVMRIVNMMLQGTGGIPGLQETVSGERNAGMFNASTNSLLSTNLVSTIAGEVARLSAPTVQTQNLGATSTNTSNSNSTLVDAFTSAMTNMSQMSASKGSETGTSTGSQSSTGESTSQQDVINMMMSLAQQITDQSSESVTDNRTKTKTSKFPTYICTFLQEVLPEYQGSAEFKALEEFKTGYLTPLKPFTLAKYDKIGPPIVAKLEKLPEAIKLAEATRIRKEFILPAAEAYNRGDSAEALSIYSDMVYSLQATYNTKE